MVEQTRIGATVFTRIENNWIGTIIPGDATLAMPELGVDIPLAEFYQGVGPAAARHGRLSYGSTFPGFMMPSGSSAALIRRIVSSSAPPRQSGIM